MVNAFDLVSLIESLRMISHRECEDGFYSCPAHPDYFGNDNSGKCNCGFEENNKTIDLILEKIKEIN